MSELILPRGVQQSKKASTESWEPYYSDIPKIHKAAEKLNKIFAWTGEESWTEKQYETTAQNLFGEAGVTIDIEWMQAMDPETGEELPFKAPSVTITGRVDKESERDHDRLKFEVRAGMADGKEGVIDPNDPGGGLKEPKRKNIL